MNNQEFKLVLKDWEKAGRLSKELLLYGKKLAKKEAHLLEFVTKIEEKLKTLDKNAKLAFPINVSINEYAAHDTAYYNDSRELFGIVKIDLGVEYNGAIGDNALTVDLDNEAPELVKASSQALTNAKKLLAEGVRKIASISEAIHDTITSFNAKPISNLTGHGLGVGKVHLDPKIPNIKVENYNYPLPKAFAIEPFATLGQGVVHEQGQAEIFAIRKFIPMRNPISQQVLKHIKEHYLYLPFSKRWLINEFSIGRVNIALREFKIRNILQEFPPLKDVDLVSQHEDSFVIDEKNRVKCITCIDE